MQPFRPDNVPHIPLKTIDLLVRSRCLFGMACAVHSYERFLDMRVYTVRCGWERGVMKRRFLASSAILTLALSAAFSMSAIAQTTEEGPGPSEQPSAPMEMGQLQGGPQSQQSD